jgi:hypothetical protein
MQLQFDECTWVSTLTEGIIAEIHNMVGLLSLESHQRVPAGVIAALKGAVPCDGLADADWPLWERLMTEGGGEDDTDQFNARFLAREALQCVITHWLVQKMQPDCDKATSLLRPDFLSLRKSIMVKPKYKSEWPSLA